MGEVRSWRDNNNAIVTPSSTPEITFLLEKNAVHIVLSTEQLYCSSQLHLLAWFFLQRSQ
jgi:hypothetical protein